MPSLWRMIAENILNIGRPLLGFSESATLLKFKGYLKLEGVKMTNQIVAFNGQNLSIINQNHQQYFTSQDVAKALGYARVDYVNNIYRRHADEFTPDMSDNVKMTLSGNLTTTTRIFSLRGCHLLAMFSKTPVAKEFRRWVLDLIEQHNQSAPALDAKAIGGIVKRCASAAIRNEFKQIVAETIREEVAPYLLKDGIKKSGVMADGLPYLNWVAGIVHGANALHVCMEGLEQRNRELLAEWSGLNTKAKEIKQIADSCRLDAIK